jgi:hypothetical protein
MTPIGKPFHALLLLVGLMLLAHDSAARTGDLTRDPADLVKQYLSLDTKGVRLESMSFESLRPYTTWKEEPLWGHVVVIEEYRVIDDIKEWEIVNRLEVVIPVEFRTLGLVYWNTAGFLPDKQTERIGFRVKAINSRWKLIEPVLPPHVSQKRFINYVREALLEETDANRRHALESLVKDLKKAKQE